VPQKHLGGRSYWYPQGRVLGGGSSINAQVYTRGNAKDYDEWASEEGCAGWGYRDVLPYFKRAEDNQRYVDDYHGYGGPLGVSFPVGPLPICDAYLRAAQEAGLPYNPDFNGAKQEGCGYYQLTIKNGRRSSAAVAYLRPVKGRPNLEVRTGVLTTRVVVERGRAMGVEVGRKGASPELARAEREVLVTSGAVGSPKLLLLSGIGPADELRALDIPVVHDLPGVGKNLQDHLDVYVVSECTGDHTYDRYARPHRAAWAGVQYLLFRQGPVASNLCEAGGFWYADPAARSPDIQFHLMLGSGIEKGAAKLKNPGVTLNSAFMRFVLAERQPGPECRTDEEIAAYAVRYAKTDYHPVGTCKMGVDAMAVVDPELRLRGIEGLRVCDSSVMPRLVSSNTNAPTIMIGEKASDLVRGIRAQGAAKARELVDAA
jgi:choline dehydrogenase-like flavoprotein